MTISVVVCTWRRSARLLMNSVHTLSHQTEAPHEIIVVDANPKAHLTEENRQLCSNYPLVKFHHAPQQQYFNMAKAMNYGIKRAEGDFIMATCMEMLFARNVIAVANDLAGAEYFMVTACGVLPRDYATGPTESIHARWAEICEAIEPGSQRRISPGAIMCAHRDWWFAIRGYDEVHYPFAETDCDLARQARYAALSQICLHWSMAQVIHPAHEPIDKAAIPPGGEWYFRSTDEIVRGRPRNPERWGEG